MVVQLGANLVQILHHPMEIIDRGDKYAPRDGVFVLFRKGIA
jgi:hypothetical protein